MTTRTISVNNWFYIRRIAFFIALVLASIWLALKHGNLFEGLAGISLTSIATLLAVKTVTTVLNALRMKVIVQLYGLRLTTEEWFGLTVTATFFAYFVPAQLGQLPRAMYLRRHHTFPFPKYGSLIVFSNLLSVLITVALALMVINYLDDSGSTDSLALNPILFTILAGTIAFWTALFFAARWQLPGHFASLEKIAGSFREGLQEFHANPKMLMIVSGILVVSLASQALGLFVSFVAVGVVPSASVVWILSSVAALTSVLNITPANLGVSEGAVILCAIALGMDAASVLPALLVSRLGSMAVHLVFGAWFSFRLFGSPLGWKSSTPL